MENEIKKTCLHSRHVALGAKMSPFAGYDMPIEYAGLDNEHTAVRTSAGVFDVSHMGEVTIEGPDAVKFVDHIFTNHAAPMHIGQCLYGMMTREDGGTVDDLLVYRTGTDSFLLVINAANIDKDVEWIKSNTEGFDVVVTDWSPRFAQIALQGPEAEKVMKEVLGIDGSPLGFYTFMNLAPESEVPLIVSRTGYTGEDGFEIYAEPAVIQEYWDKLVAGGVAPCGLGCRDTLRFEAGLPLYGDELTDDISPVESGLGMFAKTDKPGGFIGSEVLAHQKAEGTTKKVVGLKIDSPATARHGFEVLDTDGNVIGYITTGYRSLTLGDNIAMALIDSRFAKLGTEVRVKIRRKLAPATVIKKRFYTPNYKK